MVCFNSALNKSAISILTPLLLPPQIADSIRRSTIYLSQKSAILLLKADLSDWLWKSCPSAPCAAPALWIMRGLQAPGLSGWHLWQGLNPVAMRELSGFGIFSSFFFSFFFLRKRLWLQLTVQLQKQYIVLTCNPPFCSSGVTQTAWDALVHALAVLLTSSQH